MALSDGLDRREDRLMPERTLVLLRHAKSDWSGNEADIHRPLAARGRRQAPEAGRWLDANVDRIDLALVSPATRARQTWDLAAAQLRTSPPIKVDDRAYAASERQLLTIVRELSTDVSTVVLVGHNPGVEDLASDLSGEPVSMPTSAVAVLTWSGRWRDAGQDPAALRASGRPPQPDG